jgi:hypothetical protein
MWSEILSMDPRELRRTMERFEEADKVEGREAKDSVQ